MRKFTKFFKFKKNKPVKFIHSIYLEATLRNKLMDFAKEANVSRNTLIRLAICDFLASKKNVAIVKEILKNKKMNSIAYHNFVEFKRTLKL